MLEKQFSEAAEKLEADMAQAVIEYETELSRRGIVETFPIMHFRFNEISPFLTQQLCISK